jgi:two-component SAPR family response regulator
MSAPHILVLEDDEQLRSMLTMVLQDQGFKVAAVSRGIEAVEQARRQPFDLIVADIRMEGMDGLEAIEMAQKEQPEMGSLVVSGYASKEETARAAALNVGGYLRKPFKIQELLGLIHRQVAGKAEVARQKEGASSQKRLLKWSVEKTARLAMDCGELEADVVAAGRLAARLATACGSEPEAVTEIELGTLLLGLAESEEYGTLPDELRSGLPLLSREVLEGRAPAKQTSIVRLALSAHGKRGEPLQADQLAKRQPGLHQAELLETYQELEPEFEPESSLPPGQSLLPLARTLEQLGDVESADKAYQELIDQTASTADKVEACLGQARLALGGGQSERAGQKISRVVDLARSLGPVAHARVLLETGLLLVQQDRVWAAEVLTEASSSLKEVSQIVGHAQAGLALCAVSDTTRPEAYLEVLFRPENSRELAITSQRMLPLLVEQCARVEDERKHAWLLRLSRNFPTELKHCLAGGRLPTEDRTALLSALEKTEVFLPEAVVGQLSKDSVPELRARAAALAGRGQSEKVNPLLMVHSTGRFEVWLGGEPIPDREWKTRKVRALFALLASRWGKPFQDEVLTDILWPDSGEKGRKNLWWSTSMIRSALRRGSEDVSAVLVRQDDILKLDADYPYWQDTDELRKVYSEGKKAIERNDLEPAVNQLSRILTLYRGPYLDGCFLDWALELRREFSRLALQGLNLLGRALLTLERHYQAMEVGQRLLEIQSHAQDGHLLIMQAHLGLGQQADAIRQFEIFADLMQKEYELEPGGEILECYRQARKLSG